MFGFAIDERSWTVLMSVLRRVSEKEGAMAYAFRANIERYKKLLRTPLTAHERAFVRRRLVEEQAALDQLNGAREL